MIDLAPNNPYSLELATPVLAAAGSLGYGVEVARQLGLGPRGAAHGLGALVTRTTTARARRGRPALVETPAGLLYLGAEQNPGMRAVRERFAPVWAGWELPVLVSVAAESPAELAELLADLDMVEGVAGVELPLAAHGVLAPAAAGPLIRAARDATPLPLVVKLPGHAPDLAELARAAVAAGADALALVDGLPAAAPAAHGLAHGLLGGPALRPLALRAVAEVVASVEAPVIGIGGVTGPADARAMLDAGATAVGLGSVLLADLRAAARVAAGLTAHKA
ncbi:MAG TPA: dihydroorotate dehydrogenase [Chloroflexaceae bacterium]|nr:dihydroorotate dehydrogenase [Chloroflexaceae bacterium]